MKARSFIVAGFLTLSLLPGCRNAKSRTKQILACLQEPPVSSSGPVLARVGDETVAASDFVEYVKSRPGLGKNLDLRQRRIILDALVNRKVLLLTARRMGLDREESYRRRLDEMKATLLGAMVVDRENKVSDAEVLQRYQEQKETFQPPTMILASRILVKRLEGAQKARRLLKSGRPFEELAKAISLDPLTASGGGQLPPVTKGAGSALEKALSSMRIGEISGIRKAPGGYEILRKDAERRTPGLLPEAVRAQIRAALEADRIRSITDKARQAFPVTMHLGDLDGIQIP